MISKGTKWMLIIFSVCCLLILMIGCDAPKQNTKPGEFGHYIYKQQPNNIVDWHIIGMYLNDSLIVVGNPTYKGDYQVFNKNTGKFEEQKYIIR
jgi:hypothetical protein